MMPMALLLKSMMRLATLLGNRGGWELLDRCLPKIFLNRILTGKLMIPGITDRLMSITGLTIENFWLFIYAKLVGLSFIYEHLENDILLLSRHYCTIAKAPKP